MGRGGFYGLALAVVALDQAVKAWVRHNMVENTSIAFWPGVFNLTYTRNTGMAFSLLEGAIPILVAAALLVIGVIVVAQARSGARMSPLLGVALALPLGGAVGNLIDRLFLGRVTDMFAFRLIHVGENYFPIFNVADAAITVGVAVLAWRTLTAKEVVAPPQPSGAEAAETGSGKEEKSSHVPGSV